MNKKIIIEGERVHHVGYRPFLISKAWELGILNYQAKNLKENGTEIVEVSIGGEEAQLNEFTEFIKNNYPSEAKVSDVRDGEPPERVMSIEKYDRVLASEQHSTMVQAGLGMVKMQGVTIGNQEKMLTKQDQMLGKQDEMVGMQKQTTDKLDSFHHDTVQRFDNLDEKYLRISQNMERILEEMKEERKEYRTSIEKLINAILSQKSER